MNLPPSFTHRPPTRKDVAATVALVNTCAVEDTGSAFTSEARLFAEWFGDGQRPLSLSGVHELVFAPDGTLIAYIETETSATRKFFFFMLYLHPAYRTSAWYDTLRDFAESRGRAWADAIDEAAIEEFQFLINLFEGDTLAREELDTAGYTMTGFQKRMVITMETPPPPPVVPDGIELRSYRRGVEDAAIYTAWSEAMGDDRSAPDLTLEQFVERRVTSVRDFDPSLWVIAWAGEEVAAFALVQWERPGDPDAGYIRDVGVRRPWRRKGLGMALLATAFGEFYRRGRRRVSLTVDGMNPNGANQLYEKAGMTPVFSILTYSKSMK